MHRIDDSLERGALVSRELGGETLVERDPANQFHDIREVLGAVQVLKPAMKFETDEVWESDDRDSLNKGDVLWRRSGLFGSDQVDWYAVTGELAALRSEERRVGKE